MKDTWAYQAPVMHRCQPALGRSMSGAVLLVIVALNLENPGQTVGQLHQIIRDVAMADTLYS